MTLDLARAFVDALDGELFATQGDAAVMLAAAVAICATTGAATMFLAVARGTIPEWAWPVPLSVAGSAGPARLVFSVGLGFAAVLALASAPAVGRLYTGTLAELAGAPCEDWRRLLFVVTSSGALGLLQLAVVTFCPEASQRLRQHGDLNFPKQRRDRVHNVGAALFFSNAFALYCLTSIVLYLYAFTHAIQAEPNFLPVSLALLKLCLPPASCFVGWKKLNQRALAERFEHLPQELREQRARVCSAGAGQWSALLSILALFATICADLCLLRVSPAEPAATVPSCRESSRRAPLLVAVAVSALCAALAAAFWVLPPTAARHMHGIDGLASPLLNAEP